MPETVCRGLQKPVYFELAPPARLADCVECFWVSTQTIGSGIAHRVPPDGCADILYTRGAARSTLQFVGAMTRFQDFQHLSVSTLVGVRFRPAMWTDVARVRGTSASDLVLALDDLWGTRAGELMRRLDDANESCDIARMLANAVGTPAPRSPLQHAIGAMERSHGKLTLEEALNLSGLGARQFRRRCLEASGLSPKLLSRILRFRRASSLVSKAVGGYANVALECGYADQSHMIAEFQEFAGRTPRQLTA